MEEKIPKNFLIVTGTFNEASGKPSYFGERIHEAFERQFKDNKKYNIEFVNGGSVDTLSKHISSISDYKIIFWMPHIDEMENPPVCGTDKVPIHKFAQILKKDNPTAIFIQAKRNDYNKHAPFDIVKSMFEVHSNLCFVISHDDDVYNFKIYDPLGNIWHSSTEISCAAENMAEFVQHISQFTRMRSSNNFEFFSSGHISDEYLKTIRFYGWRFSSLINTEINKERFLGNASTRCMLGFPSMRDKNRVLISRRNIDKQVIDDTHFVPVYIKDDILHYYGDKPSVDAAIQVRLYEYYHRVKYIIHGHAYVVGAPTTEKYIPCGYIEEVVQITNLFKDHLEYNFAVNLIGHGCVILAEDISYFAGLGLVARPFPEDMSQHSW